MKTDKSREKRKHYKVIILGEAGVGKTSLITRYTRGKFSPQTTTTVGVDRIPLKLKFDSDDDDEIDDTLDFQVLDTSGSFTFHTLIRSYINNIDAVIFVYDITNKESFACLPLWNTIINRNRDKELVKFLVGNKSDLASDREVQFKNAKNYAEFEGMVATEVSVKEEIGDHIFQRVAKELREKCETTGNEKRGGLLTTSLSERLRSASMTENEEVTSSRDVRGKFKSLFNGRKTEVSHTPQYDRDLTFKASSNPYMLKDYIASLINYD